MEIKKVSIDKIEDAGNLKGFATVNFDDELIVKNFKIIEGRNGLFISFPSEYSKKEDSYFDTVYPLNKETRDYISDAILDGYKESEKRKPTRNNKR